jgi:3',5'-cyclic AMP phosphodiesterase CpdA
MEPMNRRLFILKAVILVALFAGHGCHEAAYQGGVSAQDPGAGKAFYPPATFIVISDIHYYDKGLGVSGKAFDDSLERDRKLLVLSGDIFSRVIDEVRTEYADFVIIPGDLTKDGEKINHKRVVEGLKRIADGGKKVFVVPGNHDIANRNAVRYLGNRTETVKTVSGDEFAKLYGEFGYSHAMERDSHSLSYIAEPVPGLWLMALDSCRWKENTPSKGPFHGGAFSKETRVWIERMLIRAKEEEKAVIAFTHHGLLEHYPSNERYYPQYLVQEHAVVSELLARHDVHLVFTGHFHAQDITVKRFKNPGQFLFDIETGSLVTYPCPYRIVTLAEDQTADITSRFVTHLDSQGESFATYARDYVYRGTVKKADVALKGYRVSREDMEIISPQIAEAYVAHLAGDEEKPDITIHEEGVGLWGKFIILMQKDLIEGWWTDLPPGDNAVKINLIDGKIIK